MSESFLRYQDPKLR